MRMRRAAALIIATVALAAFTLVEASPATSAPRAALAGPIGSGAGTISGSVTDPQGAPIVGLRARLYDDPAGKTMTGGIHATDSSGHYAFEGLAPGSYYVLFDPVSVTSSFPAGLYVHQWNGGAATRLLTAPLVVTGDEAFVVDASMALAGAVHGVVTDSMLQPLNGPITVRLYNDTTGELTKLRTAVPSGSFAFANIAPGSYHIRYGDGIFVPPVWYGGTADRASSTPVIVIAGQDTTANAAMPGPPPAVGTWTVDNSANNGTGDNSLRGMSCASTSSCMAVGSYVDPADGMEKSLAQSWNGTAWTVTPTPLAGTEDDFFRAVSCATTTSCMAVGSSFHGGVQQTLAERWNGSTWTETPMIDVNGQDHFMSGVSCPSPTWCVAVGVNRDDSDPDVVYPSLVEQWDGASWRVVDSPNPGSVSELTSVSCPSTTFCVAAGSLQGGDGSNGATVLRWDGTSWTAMDGPAPTNTTLAISGVSCVSTTSCKAVGLFGVNGTGIYATLVESWDGVAWTIEQTLALPGLYSTMLSGVSCTSATSCAAVGLDYGPRSPISFVEIWDGANWRIASSPVPGSTASRLGGVSCPAAATCLAAGSQTTSREATLIMQGPIE